MKMTEELNKDLQYEKRTKDNEILIESNDLIEEYKAIVITGAVITLVIMVLGVILQEKQIWFLGFKFMVYYFAGTIIWIMYKMS